MMKRGTGGVFVVKSMSDSSVFIVGLTAVTITALIVGYFVLNRMNTGMHRRKRGMEHAMLAKDVMTYDVSPKQLKARIVQIMVNNTLDLDMLNNAMNHILNRIDSDLQPNGLLHGLITERSIGRITPSIFKKKLAQYVKSLAAQLNVPLVNMDKVGGQFYNRYIKGGGGSGGTGYNTVWRLPPGGAAHYGFPARRISTPLGSGSGSGSGDMQIELLDETLRRY